MQILQLQCCFIMGWVQNYFSNFAVNAVANCVGSFIAIYGAWKIYSLQKKDQENKELQQIKNQQEDKLKYAVSLIDGIIACANTQCKYLGDLIEKLKQNRTQFRLLQLVDSRDLKQFADKLNREDFYNAFLALQGRNEDNHRLFWSICHKIDFIDWIFGELNNYLKKEYKTIAKIKNEYKKSFEDSLAAITQFTSNADCNTDLAKIINNQLSIYYNHTYNDKNLNYPFENLIKPLLNYFNTNMSKDRSAESIIRLLNQTEQKYQEIIATSKEFEKGIVYFKDKSKLKETAQQLETDTAQLRKDYSILETKNDKGD